MSEDDGPPAPPCRFRCNRSRMTLTVNVTLHHVGAPHINLETSRKSIKLDTLKARRKFQMNRVYPRGIECDDTKTTARLEGGSLIVEMPITKLPTVTAAAAKDAKAGKQAKPGKADKASAAAAAGKKRKKGKEAAAEHEAVLADFFSKRTKKSMA